MHQETKPGREFGLLVAVKEVRRSSSGSHVWLFRCQCGREIERHLSNVVQTSKIPGVIQSCGECVKKAPESRAFVQWNRQIKYDGHVSSLTYEQWLSIVKEPCDYCGTEPTARSMPGAPSVVYKLSGIDRINSKLEYDLPNCAPCCSKCNRAKGDMSVEEFLDHVDKIHAHRCGK
jgi:5-methylcytosine-specific restriction endonuclease McrA